MNTRPISLLLSLLCGLSLWLGSAAQAADPGAAAAALKVLTTPDTAEAPVPAAPTTPSARERMVVQRSETVDMLVRRLNPGSPFKDEVFRHALVDLNPGALPNAANNLLKRGSTLMLPNAEDLRRSLLKHYPGVAGVLQAHPEAGTEADSATASGPNKRRWVRFP